MLILIVSLAGPIVGSQVQPVFGITVDATVLTLFFFGFATIYNVILIFTLLIHDRSKAVEGEAEDHVFSLMIPCRNEEAVIAKTLNALHLVDYPAWKYQIMVINDGSVDNTRSIAEKFASQESNITVFNIPMEASGRGKSEALNKAFEHLRHTRPFGDNPNWVIGVLDSDGVVRQNILKTASYKLKDPRIGAVQSLVRINNYREGVLTQLQDIEFVTFAKITQSARSLFKGAVALGGNGQFIRSSILEEIALSPGQYWKQDALTEDLDLGTRVLMRGWENSFISTTAVYQSGVTTLASLYKQRTRWSWGALQCFFYYVVNPRVLKSRMALRRKLDLIYYLSATMLPPLILLVWALSIFGLLGLFNLYNPFPVHFMVVNSLSFLPILGYGLWSIRDDYDGRLMVPLIFLTAGYTYHWVICALRAMIHMLNRDKPHWVVTQKMKSRGLASRI
jgi:1,2-diacylglycerol 3-beta-glucosyltransferase